MQAPIKNFTIKYPSIDHQSFSCDKFSVHVFNDYYFVIDNLSLIFKS